MPDVFLCLFLVFVFFCLQVDWAITLRLIQFVQNALFELAFLLKNCLFSIYTLQQTLTF